MRKLFLAIVVLLIPAAYAAEQTGRAFPERELSALLHVTADQGIVVGVAALGGAVAIHALLGGVAWTLAGSAAGALAGDWWYAQHNGQAFANKRAGTKVAAHG